MKRKFGKRKSNVCYASEIPLHHRRRFRIFGTIDLKSTPSSVSVLCELHRLWCASGPDNASAWELTYIVHCADATKFYLSTQGLLFQRDMPPLSFIPARKKWSMGHPVYRWVAVWFSGLGSQVRPTSLYHYNIPLWGVNFLANVWSACFLNKHQRRPFTSPHSSHRGNPASISCVLLPKGLLPHLKSSGRKSMTIARHTNCSNSWP